MLYCIYQGYFSFILLSVVCTVSSKSIGTARSIPVFLFILKTFGLEIQRWTWDDISEFQLDISQEHRETQLWGHKYRCALQKKSKYRKRTGCGQNVAKKRSRAWKKSGSEIEAMSKSRWAFMEKGDLQHQRLKNTILNVCGFNIDKLYRSGCKQRLGGCHKQGLRARPLGLSRKQGIEQGLKATMSSSAWREDWSWAWETAMSASAWNLDLGVCHVGLGREQGLEQAGGCQVGHWLCHWPRDRGYQVVLWLWLWLRDGEPTGWILAVAADLWSWPSAQLWLRTSGCQFGLWLWPPVWPPGWSLTVPETQERRPVTILFWVWGPTGCQNKTWGTQGTGSHHCWRGPGVQGYAFVGRYGTVQHFVFFLEHRETRLQGHNNW